MDLFGNKLRLINSDETYPHGNIEKIEAALESVPCSGDSVSSKLSVSHSSRDPSKVDFSYLFGACQSSSRKVEGTSNRSDKPSRVLQKMRECEERRKRGLRERNERREAIQSQKLARVREEANRALEKVVRENRRMVQEAKELRLRKTERQKRIEIRKSLEEMEMKRVEEKRRILCLKHRGFLPWRDHVQHSKDRDALACQSNQLRLLKTIQLKSLQAIHLYSVISKAARYHERRLESLRLKILDTVPDFRPSSLGID